MEEGFAVRRRNWLGLAILSLGAYTWLGAAPAAAVNEEHRSPLFVYLHLLQPLEEQAETVRAEGDEAGAYRLYLRALRGYEALDQAVPDWDAVQPLGLRTLVLEGIERCEGLLAALKPAAQRENAFLRRLNQPVNVDFDRVHMRDVVKLLMSLTDVNIVLNGDLYPIGGPNPNVTLRVDQSVPLLQILRLLVQQKGLAYTIEDNYVYVGTRLDVDARPGFSSTAWFRDE